jgi:hypothetical protein
VRFGYANTLVRNVRGVTQKENASKARPELRGQTANDY